MDYTDIFRLIGWALVFMFPIVVIYLTGGPDKEPLLDDDEYQRRQRKKQAAKNKPKEEIVEESTKKNKKKNNKKKQQTPVEIVEKKQQASVETAEKKRVETVVQPETKQEEKVKEIDEHMDPTANYARVMRIKPEEVEEEWETVPVEEGWSQVKSRKPHQTSQKLTNFIDQNAEITQEQTSRYIPGLDKKQRENMARQAKKKQAKAAADALQAERLRKHQKELEKIKIQEFYSSGKGKNTPWGKQGSSKTPKSTASINEFGQLIWD